MAAESVCQKEDDDGKERKMVGPEGLEPPTKRL